MQTPRPVETDLVLLGAGHAHLEVLRRFALRPEPGVRLTLIGREPETPYSGMLPGLLRGEYTRQQAHIDLAPLAAMAKARLILAEATGFDPATRTLTIAHRPEVGFDVLSIDVGGVPVAPPGEGIGVKPIGRFLEQLTRLEAELPEGSSHRRGGRRSGRQRTGARPGGPVCQTLPPDPGLRHGRTRRGGAGCRKARGPAGPGGCRRRTGLRRDRRGAGSRSAGAIGRQQPGCRDGAVGDGRGRSGVPGCLGRRLRPRRLHPGEPRPVQRQPQVHLRRRRLRGAGGQRQTEGRRLGGAGGRAPGGEPAPRRDRTSAGALASAAGCACRSSASVMAGRSPGATASPCRAAKSPG